MVSVSSLKEVNRLRETYRNDLSLYSVPTESKKKRKRKLTGTPQIDQPKAKKLMKLATRTMANKAKQLQTPPNTDSRKRKRSESPDVQIISPPKKRYSDSGDNGGLREDESNVMFYHPVDEQWQRNACDIMGLQFKKGNGVTPGGPNVRLTTPDPRRIKDMSMDGNCLFRSLSYLITGSVRQHMAVRSAILEHMVNIGHFLLGRHIPERFTSVQQYIEETGMDKFGEWGTNIEMSTLAHLLQTTIYSFVERPGYWTVFTPNGVDVTISGYYHVYDRTKMSMYINHPRDHFQVVCGIR